MLKKINNKCNSCESSCFSEDTLKKMGSRVHVGDYTIALAGNPNTGKSTIFNSLTGLKQHTGNWPGKTVERAEGAFSYAGKQYRLVDLPGTYSLLSTSEDEEIARDFILFGRPDVTLIVADATRIERNMNLILQILEITDKAILCVNLMDEAKRNGVEIDILGLGRRLGIPVVGTSARTYKGIPQLLSIINQVVTGDIKCNPYHIKSIREDYDSKIKPLIDYVLKSKPNISNSRWLALRLLEKDERVRDMIVSGMSEQYIHDLDSLVDNLRFECAEDIQDSLTEALYEEAGRICNDVVVNKIRGGRSPFDVKLDRILTSRRWGVLIMLLLLAVVLWITIIGSNYPSDFLSKYLVGYIHPWLKTLCSHFMPWWMSGLLVDGIYLTTAWVISVMLPPMAIFFPLFTLLEDFGYLPRVAFNLDEMFRRVGAHGKQALTMTMGFGCNAAAVINTRIIDSPRERLIAIITNNFSLCNGRWPTQILLATIFLAPLVPSYLHGIVGVSAVVGIAILGILFMFLFSWVLSHTLLRGQVSSFNLELPPYRPPQFWQTIYKSVIDRTLVVLWRAIVFAAPAGAVIWLTCNINIHGQSIAQYLIQILDKPGYFMGLNGIILLAYVLAIPANEIVIPTILMLIVLTTGGHGQAGVMFDASSDAATLDLFKQGGWTLLTGINLMLFCLLHNPCSTTLYNIYKETKSFKWTMVSALTPLFAGIIVTSIVAAIFRYFLWI